MIIFENFFCFRFSSFFPTPALVSFKKKEGYEKAMARHFRVFGVNVNGVSVTTSPADDCRTVYVENTAMLTGEEFVNAINVAIQPNYKVTNSRIMII